MVDNVIDFKVKKGDDDDDTVMLCRCPDCDGELWIVTADAEFICANPECDVTMGLYGMFTEVAEEDEEYNGQGD